MYAVCVHVVVAASLWSSRRLKYTLAHHITIYSETVSLLTVQLNVLLCRLNVHVT